MGANIKYIDSMFINLALLLLRNGIFQYFPSLTKKSTFTKDVRGTGFTTGSLPGSHYFPLLVQLYFSLVPHEDVLPSSIEWWKQNVVMPDDPDQENHINIFQVVISSMTSCMDYYNLSVRHYLDDEGLVALHYMIGNMRIHMAMLYHLRQCLTRSLKKKQRLKEDELERKKLQQAEKKLKKDQESSCNVHGTNPTTTKTKKKHSEPEDLDAEHLFRAIKPHLCEHMVSNWLHFGATVLTSDTQRSESELKYVCKVLFEQTNRTYKSLQEQMMNAFLKNLRASELTKCLERRKKQFVPLEKRRNKFANYGNIEIRFDVTRACWWPYYTKAQLEPGLEPGSAVTSIHETLDATDIITLFIDNKTKLGPTQHILAKPELHILCNLSVKLFKGIVISNNYHMSDDQSQPIPFTLHCNRLYKINKVTNSSSISVFSFIEVLYSDGPTYCQVAAIVQIGFSEDARRTNVQQNTEYLIVMRLQRARSQSPLPFGLFSHERRQDGITLCYDIILADGAFRPCIAYPYLLTHARKQQFFIVPYDRIGKVPNPCWPKPHHEERYMLYEEDARVGVKSSSFPLFTTPSEQIEALKIMRKRLPPKASTEKVATEETENTAKKRKATDL